MTPGIASVVLGGLAILAGLGFWSPVEAAPVQVRFAEGVTHGLLRLQSLGGDTVGHGDLLQTARGEQVTSRLVLRLKDGSLHDETVVFSQRRVFTMLRYQLVQRGPSFPVALEATLDGSTGRYTVRSAKNGREETESGRIELPPDVYNGMVPMLLKNLPHGAGETIHLVAFTPKPRLIQLELTPVGRQQVLAAGVARQATRFALKPRLGSALSLVATLLGKTPSDAECVILTDDVPGFVRYDGSLHPTGPTLRTELVAAR
ncbi:MAG TPA: hypothetical protein VFO18_06895 [Methylomirabilota bacterium]|nr:hypothetical protein [Methylomirabilota bacterium]